jgi:hypothetical protein
MKKKRRLTLQDVARIPVTPVPIKGEYGVGHAWEYRQSEDRKAREAEAAEQRRFQSVQDDFNQTLRELNKSQKQLTHELWGRPLDCIDNPASWSGDLAADPTIGLQDAVKPFDIQADASNLRAVAVEFELNAKELTGYTLNEDGAKRLLYFAFAQAIHGKDLTTVAAWVTCFERLLECDCFDAGEIEFHHAKKVVRPRVEEVEQPRRESLEDFESIDTTTRDGSRRAKNLAENLYVEEMLPIATAWVTSIQRHYGFSPTSEDMRRVSGWIERNNLNMLAPQTYDAARRWLVASGFWPESCLTETEKFNLSLEAIDTSRLTVAQRNDLNRREQAARAADAARFGSR